MVTYIYHIDYILLSNYFKMSIRPCWQKIAHQNQECFKVRTKMELFSIWINPSTVLWMSFLFPGIIILYSVNKCNIINNRHSKIFVQIVFILSHEKIIWHRSVVFIAFIMCTIVFVCTQINHSLIISNKNCTIIIAWKSFE